MGKRRGAAASLARGLGDLAHLRLGHQDDVEGDLPQHPGDEREGAPDLRDPGPVGVPRHRGFGELQLPRELAEHGDAGFAEGGERPCGPAELGREPTISHVQEPSPRLQNRYEPPCRLQAEGGGERLLEQGAPGHDGLAVLFGEAGAGAGDAFQFGED